jgi:purine-cytosine permease-like protein
VAAPEGLAAAIMTMTGGALALAIILVDETDNTFADIYSAAVSTQNILPKVRQRLLVIIIGVVGLALATILSMDAYFNFLLLIGSVFVPLFGLLAADYFILRQRNYNLDELYTPQGAYWYSKGFNLWALLAWAIGVILYHAIARYAPWLGASIPSFVVTLLLYSALGMTTRKVVRGTYHAEGSREEAQ